MIYKCPENNDFTGKVVFMKVLSNSFMGIDRDITGYTVDHMIRHSLKLGTPKFPWPVETGILRYQVSPCPDLKKDCFNKIPYVAKTIIIIIIIIDIDLSIVQPGRPLYERTNRAQKNI